MQLPGADPDGALARALDKLAAVLGGDDGVVVDVPQPPATAELAAAVNDNARLRVSYWSANRDEATEREITPRSIFLDRGHWYVIADDSRSGESRTFRIDRFESWERTGEIDPPAEGAAAIVPPSGDQWFVDSDVPSVVLRLAPQARWAAERYPLRDEHPHGDASGSIVVRMAVANEQWLRTLLLRLGPHAAVLEPVEWHDLAARRGPRVVDALRGDRQLSGAGDAVSPEQVGQHRGGCIGVGQRVVRTYQLDPVSRAQVGKAMGQLPVGIETARQGERAQRIGDRHERRRGSCWPCARTRHRTPRCAPRSEHRPGGPRTRDNTSRPGAQRAPSGGGCRGCRRGRHGTTSAGAGRRGWTTDRAPDRCRRPRRGRSAARDAGAATAPRSRHRPRRTASRRAPELLIELKPTYAGGVTGPHQPGPRASVSGPPWPVRVFRATTWAPRHSVIVTAVRRRGWRRRCARTRTG